MTSPLKTPFGTFLGKKTHDGVTQYRGIKYAHVADQLSPPELVTGYEGDVVDATHFGPRAPAIDGCAFAQSTLIQCPLSAPDESPKMSGTQCLNLNISVPDTIVGTDKKLPVMVFIHGGGYIMGANYWPQNDPSRLVGLAGEMGMGVVVVGINYRLGILGNLASKELRDKGYEGNNSLRDQQCALRWVKRYIGAFGGDGENVTAFGESAGAASVLYHLHSQEPLFKRCISMSGTPVMLKPLPLHVAEMAYTSIIKEFGLENQSTEERIQRLTTMDPEELVAKTPRNAPSLPWLDGDILPANERTTFAKLEAKIHEGLPGMKWCEEMMLGDCQHDGNVFLFVGLAQRKAGIAAALVTSLTANLPAQAAEALLSAYGLSPETGDSEAMKIVIDLVTDVAYVAPALAYARTFPGKAYYYHFNEPNPWDGPFKGCSTHMLDAAFLFQNCNEHMSSGAQAVAKGLATDFVKFAHGVKPWEKFQRSEGSVRTYGPSEKSSIGMTGNNGWGNRRRGVLWNLSEGGKVDLDQLSVAWDMFIAGK